MLRRQAVLLLCLAALAAPAADSPPPPATLLARTRSQFHFQPITLSGQLRQGTNRHAVRVTAADSTLTYALPGHQLALRVVFQPDGVELLQQTRENGPFTPVPAPRRDDPVLGTDLAFDDLALAFLHWPALTAAGEDNLKTRRCFVIDARPGPRPARHPRARLWIDAASHALLRADLFNDRNQCIKRLEVNAVQQIENTWILREFQVSTMMPDRNLSRSRTYLNLEPDPARP
jgi:hypothetical protein